jgi:hypothetical protein
LFVDSDDEGVLIGLSGAADVTDAGGRVRKIAFAARLNLVPDADEESYGLSGAFLSSDWADAITGQSIVVDGGAAMASTSALRGTVEMAWKKRQGSPLNEFCNRGSAMAM